MLMEASAEGRVQSLVAEAENWVLESWRSWWMAHLEVHTDIAQEAAEGEAAADFEV